ncbi:hypothetical protein EIN_131840 [Entamoeba invadens IP1]|uniref:Uncharacterized protein n=1 Tax=Entamoeba invadens IP1 TaxID=370355 RepID=A0A0A1UG14_ENTIV|nr:hypothetical protein EIN_131840 [Entamoeba invadens IP1]ELP94335.1 hypothetical protein EIN_131840 [Entamoeba invadens IP1]|eukprot:XP_004261106.1 hypothetical protein EIN_131840 [Entamoeba invadens IP1]
MSRKATATCRQCGCEIWEDTLVLLSPTNTRDIKQIRSTNVAMSMATSFAGSRLIRQKTTSPSLASSLQMSDSPLQCLKYAQKENFPIDLPICDTCYQIIKGEYDREEVNTTNGYCEALKMLDDLEEFGNLVEKISQEKAQVEQLLVEIAELKEQQDDLNQQLFFLQQIEMHEKLEEKMHNKLLKEIVHTSMDSSIRFLRLDIKHESGITNSLMENAWNSIYKIEWTENGVLFCNLNIALDYQKKKYENVALCFKLIIKQCIFLCQMLRTSLKQCSLVNVYCQVGLTKETLSYTDFSVRCVKSQKLFNNSLRKLSTVVEELVVIVMTQFPVYKPLYKVENFLVNGYSIQCTSPNWQNAVKYFLAALRHLRDFVLKVVN